MLILGVERQLAEVEPQRKAGQSNRSKFPNSKVLNSAVCNYTWPLFPYVWNEIKFNVAYESDLEFLAKTMQEVAEQELGEAMMKRIRVYRRLLALTPVDELEVRDRPSVLFRVSNNTWLEAIVRYLVHPKEGGRVKTRLIKELLAKLTAAPDRVLFPKSNLSSPGTSATEENRPCDDQ